MADIARMRVSWSGFIGAPGVNTFYADPAAANPPVVELRAFYDSIKALLPTTVNITVEASGDVITDTTGAITGSWSVSPAPLVVTGTGVGVYAGGSGAVVNWNTGAIINGRRLRGKSFLVPLSSVAFAGDGTLDAPDLTILRNAATTMVAAANPLRVWHRPTVVGGANGSSAVVTSASVPDLAAVLRSRRD